MEPHVFTASMVYYRGSRNFISLETAIEIARRVLREHFDRRSDDQEPITARLEGDNWIVEGRPLPPVPEMPLELNIPHRFVMVIAQFDGQIKDIAFHGPPIDPSLKR